MKKTKTICGIGFMAAAFFLSASVFAQTTNQQPQVTNDQQNDIQNFLNKYRKSISKKQLKAANAQNVFSGIGNYESPLAYYLRNMQPSQLQTQALKPYLTPAQLQEVSFITMQNAHRIIIQEEQLINNEQAKKLADPQLVKQQIQAIKLEEFTKQQEVKEKSKNEAGKE